jgi:hypothetical protein
VHFQRIETNVGLGVPDVNGCGDGVEFWLELKQKTLRQRCLKLYGWPSAMAEEPFSTVPVAVFPFPVDARALKHAILHQGPAAGVKV